MAMLALVLAFRQTARNPDGSEGPSSLYPLLSTARIMSGPFGVIGGVYGGLLSHGPFTKLGSLAECHVLSCNTFAQCRLLVGNFGDELGLLISVGIAFLVGLACLATDKMLERPGKWSVGAGTLAALSVGLLVHWAADDAVQHAEGLLEHKHAEKGEGEEEKEQDSKMPSQMLKRRIRGCQRRQLAPPYKVG
eukprot:symbB.v1.2.024780.t1/scaffold2245.1/size172089/6